MKISTYNFKGGVGKTSISSNLAKIMDYGIITNDPYVPLERLFPKERLLKLMPGDEIPELPQEYNIIYDFGGYLDTRIISALKVSDYVIIPVINNEVILQVSINTIEEVSKYNKNIIIVANRIANLSDLATIRAAMMKFKYNYPIFDIKESKSLEAIYSENKSIREMVEEGGLKAYNYKTVDQQFDNLINYLGEK